MAPNGARSRRHSLATDKPDMATNLDSADGANYVDPGQDPRQATDRPKYESDLPPGGLIATQMLNFHILNLHNDVRTSNKHLEKIANAIVEMGILLFKNVDNQHLTRSSNTNDLLHRLVRISEDATIQREATANEIKKVKDHLDNRLRTLTNWTSDTRNLMEFIADQTKIISKSTIDIEVDTTAMVLILKMLAWKERIFSWVLVILWDFYKGCIWCYFLWLRIKDPWQVLILQRWSTPGRPLGGHWIKPHIEWYVKRRIEFLEKKPAVAVDGMLISGLLWGLFELCLWSFLGDFIWLFFHFIWDYNFAICTTGQFLGFNG